MDARRDASVSTHHRRAVSFSSATSEHDRLGGIVTLTEHKDTTQGACDSRSAPAEDERTTKASGTTVDDLARAVESAVQELLENHHAALGCAGAIPDSVGSDEGQEIEEFQSIKADERPSVAAASASIAEISTLQSAKELIQALHDSIVRCATSLNAAIDRITIRSEITKSPLSAANNSFNFPSRTPRPRSCRLATAHSGAESCFQPTLGSIGGGSTASDTAAHAVVETEEAAQARDEIGMKVVNQYTFLKELGRGRYGKVKLATTSGGEMVAIKIVPHSYVHQHKLARPCSASSDSAKRNDAPGETAASNASPMEREVKVMSRLRHKNILRLREVIDDPQAKNIYLVMNYAERGQLVSMRPDGSCTPLQFDVARGYMRQLLSGLQYLHNHNICHRDIKNENILLGANGVVYFSDFGVSSFFASPSERFDHCEGTPAYHAPEICRGEAFRGPPADVWALGVTFYAMLYGCLPFRGATLIELRESIMNDKLEFPPFVVPDELADDSIFSMSENMSMAAFNDAEVQSDVDENDGTFAEADSGAASREMSQELSRSMTGGKRKERRIVFPANARHRNGGTFSQHLDFQDLLTHMLEKDPERRFTIAQCRQHAFVHTTTGTAGRLRHLKQMGVIGKVEPPAVLSQFFPVVDMNELSCTQKPEDGADATERQSLSLDSAGANHPTSASSSALAQPVSQTSSPVLQMTPDTWVAPAGLSPEGSALSPVVPVEGFHGSQEASIPLSHRSVSAIPGGVGPPALSGLAKSQYHRPHETGNSDDDRFSRTAVLSRDHPHFVETQGDSGRRAHHSEGRARASSKEKGKRRR